jgi:hypothetical protein
MPGNAVRYEISLTNARKTLEGFKKQQGPSSSGAGERAFQ